MKRISIVFFVSFLVLGCSSKRKIVTKKKDNKPKTEQVSTTKDPEKPTPPKTPPTPKTYANTTEAYIANFSDIAKMEMRKFKIPASITLAQGILESGSGKGRLAVEANNHFGIKCHGWKGQKIYHDDDASQECFRKYKHAQSSFEDHSAFLTTRGRYSKLFQLKEDDYKGWAKGLRAAGYATDRKYPQKLISLIERYELYKYDEQVLGKKRSKKKVDKEVVTRKSHTVVKGDTLYSLSRTYGISVDTIKQKNKLTSNNLSIGQVLKIQ